MLTWHLWKGFDNISIDKDHAGHLIYLLEVSIIEISALTWYKEFNIMIFKRDL